jgi:hypothetical protein
MFNNKRKVGKLFRWIWRANGVFILFAGIGLICLLAIGIFSLVKEAFRLRHYNSVRIQTEPSESVTVKFGYGKFARIEGTDFAMSPISSEQKTFASVFESSSSSYKTGYSNTVRNFAFLNLADQSIRFLLPNNDILIVANSKITAKKNSSDSSENSIACLSYQVVVSDTNGDKQLSSADKKTIALSSVDGTDYLEMLKNVDDVVGEERIDDDLMLYTYVLNGKTIISLISLTERKIVSTKELPVIN